MKTNQTELIKLIDNAIEIANKISVQETADDDRLDILRTKLNTLKNQVINDNLPPSQKDVTLGLSRQVSDWIDSLDSPLLKAVSKIDKYYQQKY